MFPYRAPEGEASHTVSDQGSIGEFYRRAHAETGLTLVHPCGRVGGRGSGRRPRARNRMVTAPQSADTRQADGCEATKRGAMKRSQHCCAVALPGVVVAIAVALWGENGASSAGPVPGTRTAASPRPIRRRRHRLLAAMASSPSQSLTRIDICNAQLGAKGRPPLRHIESINLDTLPGTVAFDLAYLLTGEEANQAAAEDDTDTRRQRLLRHQ